MINTLVNTGSFRGINIYDGLDILSKYNLLNLEFNLRPIMDENVNPDNLANYLKENGFTIKVAAGGWCDFFINTKSFIDRYYLLEKQMGLVDLLGTKKIRLFFGQIHPKYYDDYIFERVIKHVSKLTSEYNNKVFLFENHDALSTNIEFLERFFTTINNNRVQLNFDPVNFERFEVDCKEAFNRLYPYIGHMHVKGLFENQITSYTDSVLNFDDFYNKLKSKEDISISLEYESTGDIITNLIKDYYKMVNDIKRS